MQLFVDLCCLQQPEVARHTACVLRYARKYLPGRVEIIGLVNEALSRPTQEHAQLCDRLQHARTVGILHEPAVYLQPAAGLHDPLDDAPFVGRPHILSCAIVHDVVADTEVDSPLDRRRQLAGLYWLKLYQLFCPLSHQMATRLRQLLDVPVEAVTVTGASVGPAFANFEARAAFTLPHRSRFATGAYFVLPVDHAVADSLADLLAAYAELTRTEASPAGLVVLGCRGEKQRRRFAREYGRHGGRMELLDIVDEIADEDRAALYHRALATLLPATTASFAWTALEAMACGCPVLAASSEVHQELLGPDALFSPDDPADLTAVLARLLHDPSCGNELRQDQARLPASYHEELVAQRLWSAVARLLPAAPGVLHDRLRKPRLAFVSPYPPEPTDVADYTADSLRSLARHATIDVYTDTPAPRRDPWVRHFYPISDLAYLRNEYDRIVTVVGDSPRYARAIDLHLCYGGACLLHHEHLIEYTGWLRGIRGMMAEASRILGRRVSMGDAFDWALNYRGQVPVQFLDEVVRRAAPVLVHSRVMQTQLSRRHGVPVCYLPYCSRLHFSDEDLTEVSRLVARQRLEVAADQILVVLPGPFTRPDGPLECLWAVEFLHHWDIPVEMHLLDSPGKHRPALEELACRLNLKGAVRIPDAPLSEQTYRDSLLAADYAIAVRGPGFGQPTQALVDCIVAGLLTVANEDTAQAVEAPGYVRRVPDHLSPLLIAERIADAHQEGHPYARTQTERDEYVEKHQFDRYAAELLAGLGLHPSGGSRVAA